MSESNQATSSATATTTTLGGGCWDVWGIVLFPLRVLLGCTAFGMGACFNLCCDFGRGRRDKKPDWEETKADLTIFLQESGIGEELQETTSRGKFRLFANLRLLHVLQRKIYPQGRPEACKMEDTDETVDLKDAGTFMKFATAAYGPQVIANAVFESGERVPPGPLAKTQPAVLKHVGIKDEENVVVVMNLAHGEDVGTLRHYAIVDHARKALVLAVRGTYSWSSTMANCAGFTTEFCNIEVHAGMVRLARGVWDASGPAIVHRFNDLPTDYEFVITGHSLGAGVAGLINLLVHHEEAELRDSRSIRCFLYGGPPTISRLSLGTDEEAGGGDLIAKAVACTSCVVFKRDIVPFISVHAIRRLLSMARVVDNLNVPLWKKPLLDHEIIQPSNELVESFQQRIGVDLPAISGAPALYIPASAVAWIDEEKQPCCCSCQHSYRVTLCDPRKLVDVGPLVGPSGISDHLTGRYEYSLEHLS